MPRKFNINKSILQDIATNNHSLSAEDVVISGISGRLPESSNIEEFQKHLFDGTDMVTADDRRWPVGLHGMPPRNGRLKDLASFDASFFGIHAKQAHTMDPQVRILLELTYEAIVDSGINPSDIRGSNTGVFVGATESESNEFWTQEPESVVGYSLLGSSRTMFSNRISYAFDFHGPSYTVNTACSSSMYGLQQALNAIRTGQCDAAIVGGTHIMLKPENSLQIHRLNMLAKDGKCKSFDDSGDGYVRSEAAVVIFLQKHRDARRVYASVVHAKTNNDGYKEQGITYPSGKMQNKLMREAYSECGIDPAEVSYFEAHGTGTKVGDPEECNSIADLFCKNRKRPLLMGSVKSNMGHSEPVSGLCAIVKMIISMETGTIPGNLHFKSPNPDIPAILDGRIQVIDKAMPWDGSLAATNSFGFGGANSHAVFRKNPKPKTKYNDCAIPKLVGVSGRTRDAVDQFLDRVKQYENDHEFVSMVQDLHNGKISSHPFRGYQILGQKESLRVVTEYTDETRPVWYVFSGMGTQWPGMGKALFSFDSFNNSILTCAKILKPFDFDLVDLIENGTEECYSNVLNCSVCITAIQIAMVDLLTSLNIQQDGIVGHSIGEIACAYADGSMTLQQTILAAYWRGRCILESKLPEGAMAAIGLDWEEAKRRCPNDVFAACHNSADSVTISGSPESLNKFVSKLKAEGVFAKKVDSAGCAFHSKYMQPVAAKMKQAFEKVLDSPKKRSSKWISSSVPEGSQQSNLGIYCSVDYFINNLLSPVLFHDALQKVPENAIVVEIAPHCLLQAILRRSLPKTCVAVSLSKRDQEDGVKFLLSNLGNMFLAGAQVKLSQLYPAISYPVGRGTPMINSIIGWDHSTQWSVADFTSKKRNVGENVIEIDMSQEKNAYLSGHGIDGRVFLPVAGYMILVWKTIAKMNNVDFKMLPVVFEQVRFERPTILPKGEIMKFMVNISESTGQFEVRESGDIIATGRIRIPENVDGEFTKLPELISNDEDGLIELRGSDIYKELHMRGYEYQGLFKGLLRSNNRGIVGEVKWDEEWYPYLDTIVQFYIVEMRSRGLYLSRNLEKLIIDPIKHYKMVENVPKGRGIPIYKYQNEHVLKSGGVELKRLKVTLAPRKQQVQREPVYQKYLFVPFFNDEPLDQDQVKAKFHAITVLLNIVRGNLSRSNLKITEIAGNRAPENILSPTIIEILEMEPFAVDIQLATDSADLYQSTLDLDILKYLDKDIATGPVGQDLSIVIASDVLPKNSINILQNLRDSVKPQGFIILEESDKVDIKEKSQEFTKLDLILVARQKVGNRNYVLLKRKEKDIPNSIVIKVDHNSYNWVKGFREAFSKITNSQKIILLNKHKGCSGLLGLVTCILYELPDINLQYLYVHDDFEGELQVDSPLCTEQLKQQLIGNVMKNGKWGSYNHLRFDRQKDTPSLAVEHAFVNPIKSGDLSSLRWIESPLKFHGARKADNKELCTVYYSALNNRDVILASGNLPPDVLPDNLPSQHNVLGVEFSGQDSFGRRVMGLVPALALATSVLADIAFLWEIPSKWTLEQAATIPVAYATAYYALCIRGQLKSKDSVLVTSASEDVGIASITIALHKGCKVFTVVDSKEKREFVNKLFPQLADRNIETSNDTSFEQTILGATKGRGVDVVLNSLTDEKMRASLLCLATGGRFLEIGREEMAKNTSLGLAYFLKNMSFHGVILDDIFDAPTEDKVELAKLMKQGISSGVIKPLPATVFPDHRMEEAFRFMAKEHTGKVLLKIREEGGSAKKFTAIPRLYFNPQKSYIVAGGLGDFGLELTYWMISRGAKHLILLSRSGVKNGYQSLCLRKWREMGANVIISQTDISNEKQVADLLILAKKFGPVGGIFHLAAVLRDSFLENLTEIDFQVVGKPKIEGTINLDMLSRIMCPELDYFLCISSVSCAKGNIGQANYGFANSEMERVVEERRANGYPALVIQYGAMGDVGMTIETIGDTEVAFTIPQKMISILRTFDFFLLQPEVILLSSVNPEKYTASSKQCDKVSPLEAVPKILDVKDSKALNQYSRLGEIGMDSLILIEIKQTLRRNYDLVLSSQEIRALIFAQLCELSTK